MTLLKNKKYQVFWAKIISNGDSVAMNVNIIVVAIKMTDKGDMIRKKIQHMGEKIQGIILGIFHVVQYVRQFIIGQSPNKNIDNDVNDKW